jgi:SAM-dependent methyltransferase
MTQPPIRFEDGAAYERGMGVWSRLAGETFLDWLSPSPGQRWIDVGCGSGAFSELLVQRCAPSEVQGVDPSDGQLAFARTRPAARVAAFSTGNAMALPFGDDRFDAAVMALVIFFVPEPPRGVAEMARVVRPGGLIAAYAWDMAGGGFPFAPIQAGMRAMGLTPAQPPSADASRLETLNGLWSGAGLVEVETRSIAVERGFADFDDYWTTSTNTSGTMRPVLAAMTEAEIARFKDAVRASMPSSPDGGVTWTARANAIKGRVPAAG